MEKARISPIDYCSKQGFNTHYFQTTSKIRSTFRLLISLLLAVAVSACSTQPKYQSDSRYTMKVDRGPAKPVDISHVKEPVPKVEPKSKRGNRSSYQVWGKTYKVMDSAENFIAEGEASWYGKKFHGHTTSNGEVYDMYSFSAAHKNLPLPTYLKVTNLKNQKSVIVRVNDRGPFHGDRIVDLSYAAAARLGFVDTGTAPVRIEAINPVIQQKLEKPKPILAKGPVKGKKGTLLQVRSYLDPVKAEKFRVELSMLVEAPVFIEQKMVNQKEFHRVKIGPVIDQARLNSIIQLLAANQFGTPLLIPNQPANP